MRIKGIGIFALKLPFVHGFRHAGRARAYADSIIIKLHAADGTAGYGEAVARPYVTGETVPACIRHMTDVLWPAVRRHDYAEVVPCGDPLEALGPIDASLPSALGGEVIAWHGARAAFETALVDLLFKRQGLSLAAVLPARRSTITYSGVIGLGRIDAACRLAQRYRDDGFSHYKCKIDRNGVSARVEAVRRTIGPAASLRLDANGDFSPREAVRALAGLDRFDVVCIEQPVPRTDDHALPALQRTLGLPLMTDESLVTLDDARRLIDAGACGFFNLRLAKCGGLTNALRIARLAQAHGIRYQVGCQAGETSILSAVGRHLAAYLPAAEFVEGSFGPLLLIEDIADPVVGFGAGGRAPLLEGGGIGVCVRDAVLDKYAVRKLILGEV